MYNTQKIDEDNQLKSKNIQGRLYRVKNSASCKGYFSIYIDIKKGDKTIVIEPYVSRQKPALLKLELWNRESKKSDWNKEEELFVSSFPGLEKVNDGSWGECLLLETIDFNNKITSEEMVNKLLKIIKILV